MRKEIHLIGGLADESYQQFSDRIISLANSLSQQKDVRKVKVTYTLNSPPKISIIPFKKSKIAAISVYYSGDGKGTLPLKEPGFSGSYEVDEAIPVAYEKTWNDGKATPGTCLLTLFRKKPGINFDTFIDRWHNGHTPLSLKIHPLWHYNRNVVREKLSYSSYEWDGIVEEHTRTVSALLNPLKFFGNPFIMIYNMLRVYFDTNSFLDYKTIEPYLVTEIQVKS